MNDGVDWQTPCISAIFWLSWPVTNSSAMLRFAFIGWLLLLSKHLAAQELLQYKQNKVIPAAIEESIRQALSHYPELEETTIHFVFTDKLEKSIMAARPTFWSLFKKKQNRTYKVLINPAFKLGYGIESINRIPDSVMVGWLGHELGHIMDYEHKSAWGMMGMGIAYSLSRNYVRKAERIADAHAVNREMGAYLVAKKWFILLHTELPEAYRNKIEALYLSPEDIGKLVADLESDDNPEYEELRLDDEKAVSEGEVESHGESVPGNS